MEKFKIDNFSREYKGVPFPSYYSMTWEETEALRIHICKKLGIENTINPLEFVQKVDSLSAIYQELNATDDTFSFKALLERLDLKLSDEIYINWYRFDTIDRIKLEHLDLYFDDLWYSETDDIDILDVNLSWIISISHFGKIKYNSF